MVFSCSNDPEKNYFACRPNKYLLRYCFILKDSGKTFSALKKLEQAKSGIYCGPLRLLAHEIHEKLNSNNVKCNLVTGEQKVLIDGAQHFACTVEMADLSKHFEVGKNPRS